MTAVIAGMFICLAMAVAVVGLVAVPARRAGRELLTSEGEEIMAIVKDRADAAIQKTGELVGAARDRTAQPPPE